MVNEGTKTNKVMEPAAENKASKRRRDSESQMEVCFERVMFTLNRFNSTLYSSYCYFLAYALKFCFNNVLKY